MEQIYQIVQASDVEPIAYKTYNVFTKGSFDCVHLGHFILLANLKMQASKHFNCPLNKINLIALLSTQDGGKHKGIEYTQNEEERRKMILLTGVVNSVEFCDETIEFIAKNVKRIDAFALGADQVNTAYFKSVMERLELSKSAILIMNERLPGLSSTLIRKTMADEGVSLDEAKRKIESKYLLTEKDRIIFSLFYLYSIITEENMEVFNFSLRNFIPDEIKIYLGGPQGVGKTTLSKKFAEVHTQFERSTSSEGFMEYLGIDREALEYVDETNRESIDNMIEFMRTHHKKLLLDGHFAFGDRTTDDHFDLKVFLTAPIEEILRRKMMDSTRERTDNLTLSKIVEEQYKKLVRACRFSSKVFVLRNDGNISSSLKQLERFCILRELPKNVLRECKLEFADDLLNNMLAPPISRKEYQLALDTIRSGRY